MTLRRRLPGLALWLSPLIVTGGAWWISGPDDYRYANAQDADNPPVRLAEDPAPKPEPKPDDPVVVPVDPPPPAEFTPKLLMPDRVDEGQPIEARVVAETLPAGAKFRVKWETAAQWRAQAGPGQAIYLWAKLGSTNDVRANWVLVKGDEVLMDFLAGSVTVGEPTPPKPPVPLSELAGKDAAALSLFYTTMLGNIAEWTNVAAFHVDHDVGLKYRKLETNGARDGIAALLHDALGSDDAAPLDVPKVSACLERIIAELGPRPPPGPDDPPPTTATAATYVYEKDQGEPPSEVRVGLDRVNREKKIPATLFEEDTRDGDDQVPDQYRVALEAAAKAGLPAFVVQAGDKVLVVVKSPTMAQQIVEAVK